MCLEWNVVSKHCRDGSSDPLFTDSESATLKSELAAFLRSKSLPGSVHVEPFQPFLLDCWEGLCRLTGDPDGCLPGLLRSGVPTGVLEPIEASGAWQPLSDPAPPDEDLSDLSIHTSPGQSGLDDEELTLSLMMKVVEAGFAFELPGGEAAARQRWGNVVAAGKLGISHPPGKKPRPTGDGTVSGANPACRIHEKLRLPTLESIQRFLSSSAVGQRWAVFSFDVRGAHKLVRVRESEQGLSCFVVKGTCFVYRSCYFGCSWAAYWFSRVGVFVVRQTPRLLWVRHGLCHYVADGLSLFPLEAAPLLSALCNVLSVHGYSIELGKASVRRGPLLDWLESEIECSQCMPAPGQTEQNPGLALSLAQSWHQDATAGSRTCDWPPARVHSSCLLA